MSQISEKEARQVAESAREQGWEKPSFGKELFLGNLRLDLIHPQPKLDPAAVEKGEAFLARLREFLVERGRPARDRARGAASPTPSSTGSRSSARWA